MKTEKIKIDASTFNTVLEMLNSNDTENASTALMAMEQMNIKEGLMYFVLLYRATKEKANLWNTHAPTVVKKIESLGIDKDFSFRSIWENLGATATDDQKNAYKIRFEITLNRTLSEWGFKSMLKDMDVVIKFKE